ncbi:MAG: negative regulator of flagellin synthesis FlgM [Halioglobus sp.]|jgi:negative regulator of flagellin synthesis FlgM
MTQLETIMNVKPPRTGISQGSPQAGQVSGSSTSESKGKQSVSAASGDTVSLTQTAAELLKLEENLANIPDIDNGLVSSIQASIAQGTYQVEPEKIAERLMAIEKDLR